MRFRVIWIWIVLNFASAQAGIRALVIQSMNDGKINTMEKNSIGYLQIMKNRGWNVELTSSNDHHHSFENYDLVVIENSNQLNDSTWTKLKTFQQRGGCIWMGSTNSNVESDRHFQQLNQFFNGQFRKLPHQSNVSQWIQLKGESPVTLKLLPGHRIKTDTDNSEAIGVEEIDSNKTIAYWSNLINNPDDYFLLKPLVAMFFHSGRNNDRLIWCGFQISNEPFASDQLENFTLTEEILDWLSGNATIGIAAWKYGRHSALSIQCISDYDFPNIRSLLKILRKHNAPITIFTSSEELTQFSLLTKELLKFNSEFAINGIKLNEMTDESSVKQAEIIRKDLDKFSRIGLVPKGVKLHQDQCTQNTLNAVQAEGLEYLSTISTSLNVYPQFIHDKTKSSFLGGLVLFSKSNLDDYDLFIKHKKSDAFSNAERLYKEFLNTHQLYGLYQFSFSASNISQWNYNITLDYFLQKIQKDQVWLATAAEIAQWVRQREQLKVSKFSTDTTVYVEVINLSNETIEGVVLIISQPKKVGADFLEVVNVSKGCTFDFTDTELLIELPPLPPKAIFTAKLAERTKGWFKVSLKHLPKIVRWSILITLIFFVAAGYYLFIAKKRHIHAAAENNTLKDQGQIRKTGSGR
ncbi:MAG: hypothetical protein N2450_05405 [bacterium]|nr:hypothetical protein [bacterium]